MSRLSPLALLPRSLVRALGVLVLTLFAWVVPFGAVAHADTAAREEAPVAAVPADAPLVLQPASLRIPVVPADYIEQDLGWLKLRYTPRAKELVKPLVQGAEEVKARLTVTFDHPVLERVEVRVAPTFEEMATLAPDGLPPPPYASGVAYRGLGLVLLTLRPPDPNGEIEDLSEVFRHELVHVALDEAVLGHAVPRWFHEGLAIQVSGEDRFKRLQTLWSAVLSGTLVPLQQLDRRFGADRDRNEVQTAYAESADFVRFLLRDGDRLRFSALIDRVRGGQGFEPALADAYGTDLRKLEYQWTEGLSKRYTILPVLTGGGLLWVFVIALLVVGFVRRRKRAKATLARWEREEAAELAALEALRDPDQAALLEAAGDAALAKSGVPVVEHQGRFYILH